MPQELYVELFARVRSAPSLDAARFLARQGRAFIEHVVETRPDDLAVIMADAAEVAGQHDGLRLLVKVETDLGRSFDEGRRAIEGTAESALWERGCIEVLWSEDFDTPIGASVLRSILLEYRTAYREALSMLVERVRFESRNFDDADELVRYVDHFDDVLDTEAKRLLSADEYEEFARAAGSLVHDAREAIREHMVGWQSHLDSLEDEWRERRHDPPIHTYERGIFSDVDE